MNELHPLTQKKVNHLRHMINENEHIQLGEKSLMDLELTCKAIAGDFKKPLDKMREENFEKRWNELKQYIKRYPLSSVIEDIVIVMGILDNKEYARDHKPKYIRALEEEENC